MGHHTPQKPYRNKTIRHKNINKGDPRNNALATRKANKGNDVMKKKIIVAVLIAIVFVGTFVFLWAKSQPQPEQYTELTASVKDLKKTTVITGRIEPRNEVNVKPQISGIITEIMKEAGQPIQAGEVIAKVKVIPDMGQLSGAQARVRLANINLEQAKAEYERE